MEVPTILTFLMQTVDNPVPHGGGRRLQGLLPGQNSTVSGAAQIVDIPSGRGLDGFLPRPNPTALTVEQTVDIPAPVAGLQDFRPGQGSASSSFSHSPAGVLDHGDELVQGFFRTFPRVKKKCEGLCSLHVGTGRAQKIHAGSL